MPAILRVETAGGGSSENRALTLRPGEAATVGRRAAGLAIPEDTAMSAEHFSILYGPDRAITLQDLGSANGCYVNGKRVCSAALVPGDKIQAGRTAFRLDLCDPAPPLGPADVLSILRGYGDSLYAILDAARDPQIIELLRDSDADYVTLYEGKSAETLAEYAPYLARPAMDPWLLESLVQEGWGRSWGVYLLCAQALPEIRKHLRRLLMVELQGRMVYFRFYDPRVLRAFLPTCSNKQAREFFGPVETYVIEGEHPGRVLELKAL
jgi:hypothetical protein